MNNDLALWRQKTISEIQKFLDIVKALAPQLVERHTELIRDYFGDNLQLALSSLRRYAYTLRLFFSYLEKHDIDFTKIDVTTVNQYYRFRLKSCQRGVVNNQMRIIYSFLRHLYWEETISDKVWRKLERQQGRFPKARGSPPKRVLKHHEVAQLFESVTDERSRIAIWILADYGLRPSELAKLRDKDVDLEDQNLIIHDSKRNKTRYIPIPDSHVPKWHQWFSRKRLLFSQSSFVIPNTKYPDRALSTVQIARIVKKADPVLQKHIHPYLLRRTAATLARRSGIPREILADILGHEDPSTTDIYVQSEQDVVREYWKNYKDKEE